ncbi:MAG: hypothetical protein IH984_07970 [Planctomycetes bacterium]|nr:hypothetical protein [Planctomycetota bacterium]
MLTRSRKRPIATQKPTNEGQLIHSSWTKMYHYPIDPAEALVQLKRQGKNS